VSLVAAACLAATQTDLDRENGEVEGVFRKKGLPPRRRRGCGTKTMASLSCGPRPRIPCAATPGPTPGRLYDSCRGPGRLREIKYGGIRVDFGIVWGKEINGRGLQPVTVTAGHVLAAHFTWCATGRPGRVAPSPRARLLPVAT
jgi:hypothetical protein